MRYILAVMLILSLNVSADYVKKTMVICDEEKTVFELDTKVEAEKIRKGGVDMELWLMSHNCKVIDKNTEIKAIGKTIVPRTPVL